MAFDPNNAAKPRSAYAKIADFSRIVGITRRAVQYKVDNGKLKGAFHVDDGGRIWIDIDKAIKLMEYKSPKEINNQKTMAEGYVEPPVPEAPRSIPDEPIPDNVKSNQAYNKARSANEVLKMQTAQIELERLKGSLVSMEMVKREQFLMARLLRDAIMAIPDRVSSELAAARDEKQVHFTLMSELRAAFKSSEALARETLNAQGK